MAVCLGCSSLLLTMTSRPAQAAAFLQVAGGAALPLRAKTIHARVVIDGAFAVTQLVLSFEHDPDRYSNEPVEAVFYYALPPGAVVTSFSHRQVPGRIVDEPITRGYGTVAMPRHATLPQLRGRNVLRARLFPAFGLDHYAVSDPRVEITWVQVLPSSGNAYHYQLPLLDMAGHATRLKALNVDVQVKAGGALAKVMSNYAATKLPQDGRVYHLALSQFDYHVVQDLRVSALHYPVPLLATLWHSSVRHTALAEKPTGRQSQAGAQDGYFALALTPEQAVRHPAVELQGLRTSSIVPARLPDVRAGGTLLVTGRYQGSDQGDSGRRPAILVLTGDGARGRLRITGQLRFDSEGSALAVKLWAARRIQDLEASRTRPEPVAALSKQYDVPSRYTIWLAVDPARMQTYRWHHVSDELDVYCRELWIRIADRTDKGARGRRLRQRIDQLSRGAGLDPKQEMTMRLGSALQYAASTGWYYDRKPKTRYELRYARLQQELRSILEPRGVKPVKNGAGAYFPHTRDTLANLRRQLLQEYGKPHPDGRRLRQLESRFALLYGATYRDPRDDFVSARETSDAIEQKTAEAEQRGDTAAVKALQAQRKGVVQRLYGGLIVRIGDPLISVQAPPDARQVVALMPDGSVKELDFNPTRGRWEGCFDIPTYAAAGDYLITIIVLYHNGTRRQFAMHYSVDLTPPVGTAAVQTIAPGAGDSGAPVNGLLRLEVERSGDTARAAALLPWGEKVQLQRSDREPGRFFTVVAVPAAYRHHAVVVTFILTDRGHNRTIVTADMTK